MCHHHPEVLDDALTDEQCKEAIRKVTDALNLRSDAVHMTDMESAELLVGDAHLSQRAYKAIRTAFLKKNLVLARSVW